MASILVVDDDQGMREFLEIMLIQEGHSVKCACDGKQALGLCNKHKFDLAITDLKMPKVDGIDFLKGVKEISPETMVIVITAYASGGTAVTAMKEGAYDYIEKNFDIEDLKKIVQNALDKRGSKEDDAKFLKSVQDADRFGNIIGKSREMLKVYSLINKVAETIVNVLILGESGTGKELVARAIHENSPRKGKPFVTINCGGIPENLLESELFGYMKGSFTGAYSDKPGLFEIANGGTIFLDEIGELPTILQVKLLRAIQEKTFRRVGGSDDVKVDVRIIAATNQDLAKKVKDASFREDLFYRLNVVAIEMPPLRKRKEDIPLLTDFFLRKYSEKFGKETKTISTYSMELLMDYAFPGNVRELENIIEKSVALGMSNIVLPENFSLSQGEYDCYSFFDGALIEGGINLNKEMDKFEKNLIEKALGLSQGSKSGAAKILNVSLDSLRYRIEKLGV
ncbi:fused response regulator of ato opeon, in two-component system with AtoS: response regulator; sigma54 interaction protein [uncultured Desulfobacterium sp.]|uniref:Fused response regulator of ato opeon, in two-component system with AtoS: response regulator sigma54 interaction protein n=1 Tax=uncultured Desulfobacterium sp. TaxID=201089 RepID=A0A445MX40_9BACT|nr:fused response regulator of ato opeon, in two-component system with AtoS: response regulator; sigma54 interaction protein [uncultured Desulfobacterium sp.]